MRFEQELRVYLERREHEASHHTAFPRRQVDVNELHRHLLARLRAAESAGEQDAVVRLFTEWPDKLGQFARYIEALPRALAPVDRRETAAFACRVLDAAIHYLEPGLPLVDRLEMQRIAAEFFVRDDANVETYALENRLVRTRFRRRPRLTELGRVFLQLRGRDAARWLLTSEVLQSSGRSDPWHASRELLESSTTTQGVTATLGDDSGYASQTLNRLFSLGVLEAEADDRLITRYRASLAMHDVVKAARASGPWHTAVRALLDDERSEIVPESSSSATEATVEQTKLIAHEVRNALIPVRHDIDALRSVALEPNQRRRIDDARDGVVRVLSFIEDMIQASELITEPMSRCEIASLVDDALSWIDPARRVQRNPELVSFYTMAPRTRLTRAISNVVGNAIQATPGGEPVRVTVESSMEHVRIRVDDGGPGVPIEHRGRVFLEGVTMRKDGAGSGFGLAFAQRVVEGTLRGRIWCEDSDLGGARFVLEIPEASLE